MEAITINEIYLLILKKLEAIEKLLDNEEEEIRIYFPRNLKTLEAADLLLAGLKSTRTSFEIMRDEIEELHQLTVSLLKKKIACNGT